jgi:hypothetical protein
MVLPHPLLPIGSLRLKDVVTLMMLGAVWELIVRFFLILVVKRKPTSLQQREATYKLLEQRVTHSRAKGPSEFVATSKLERQQLAEQKSLADVAQARQQRLQKYKKRSRNMDLCVCGIVYILWYGIPLLEFSPDRLGMMDQTSAGAVVMTEAEGKDAAMAAFKAFLFPLSYVGMGIKLSRFGLTNPHSSFGALLVFWSAQTTVAKIMDGVEALMLY